MLPTNWAMSARDVVSFTIAKMIIAYDFGVVSNGNATFAKAALKINV